jgi:hypothetical protein
MDLGLNTLTDDQIVELARQIAAELSRRSPATVDAAKAAVAAATARATETQDEIWANKKWLAALVANHLGDGWSLNVWLARDRNETRVYLDNPGRDRHGRETIKYCYHLTGGARHAPGELTIEQEGKNAKRRYGEIIKIIARHAARLFPAGERIDCDGAAAMKYDIPPEPQDLIDALEGRARHEAAQAARNAYQQARWAVHYGPVNAERERLRAQKGLAASAYDTLDIVNALTPLRKAASGALEADMAAYDAAQGGIAS